MMVDIGFEDGSRLLSSRYLPVSLIAKRWFWLEEIAELAISAPGSDRKKSLIGQLAFRVTSDHIGPFDLMLRRCSLFQIQMQKYLSAKTAAQQLLILLPLPVSVHLVSVAHPLHS